MNKTKYLAFLAAAAYAVVAATVILGPIADPPSAEAMLIGNCFCDPFVSQTRTLTSSTGGTCATAEGNLLSKLRAEAGCSDGLCFEELVITQECEMDDPKWYPVGGFLRFKCQTCI